MPRTRREGEGGPGDWSTTGTFLRKPTTGWLHEDRELIDGCSINYQVKYLGCVEVKQSMRTLQYTVRTQVTKEAITRMAEQAGRIPVNKKRKLPKQINKLLGASDMRWAADVNLAISADQLQITNTAGREIMNHSLPSISFASGGDGLTIDLIGYVAKDPVHERACHVFEAQGCSQYVLTTIGQAFELRYKIYLSSPRAQSVSVSDRVGNRDAWGPSPPLHTYEEGGGIRTNAPLPQLPPGAVLAGSSGIYSDLPEFPPPESPLSPEGRSRVYSKLPGFPLEESYDNGPAQPRLENPYDTMGGERTAMQFSETGVYSNPGDVMSSMEEGVYDNHSPATIRQQSNRDSAQLIELVTPAPSMRNAPLPPPPLLDDEDYSIPLEEPTPSHSRPPQQQPPPPPKDDAVYDNRSVEQHRAAPRPKARENLYDDPHSLGKVPHVKPTAVGMYDNPSEIVGAAKGVYDNCEGVMGEGGRGDSGRQLYDNAAHMYEDSSSGVPTAVYGNQEVFSESVPPGHMYDSPTTEQGGTSFKWKGPHGPKFDDTIYAVRSRQEGASSNGHSFAHMGRELREALPTDPLSHQTYFHGSISRDEAEALLEVDGDFLVRESSKRVGQYVLTGLAGGQPQHLLLVDREGKVKSRDHEFDGVPHLVQYFMEKKIPLVVGNSQVYLSMPVVNAFPLPSYR